MVKFLNALLIILSVFVSDIFKDNYFFMSVKIWLKSVNKSVFLM